MMGKTHIRMGLAAGMGVAAVGAEWLGLARAADVALWCALAGGSGRLSDIDHHAATVTRSLGPVTWLLHRLTVWTDRAVYAATRTRGDPPTMTREIRSRLGGLWPRRWRWSSSHRRFTHTYPGAVVAGLLVAAACLSHPAVAVALLVWLVALGGQYVLAGAVLLIYPLSAVADGMSFVAMGEHVSQLGVVWGAAVVVGCVAHCWGDSCTRDGAPLWFPLRRGGQRWAQVGPPVRIGTDGLAEHTIVTWALLVLIVYLGWVLAGQWLPAA